MNITLWIIAGLLAAAFLASGAMKLLQPKEKVIASGAAFLEGFGAGSIKAIGGLEVLGGLGLVLPPALDVAPILAPLAAVGLALMMVVAVVARLRHSQHDGLVVHLVVVALFASVVWGRFGPEPFSA